MFSNLPCPHCMYTTNTESGNSYWFLSIKTTFILAGKLYIPFCCQLSHDVNLCALTFT